MRIKNMQITEQSIIKAAWELLEQIGIEDFSMRQLADLLHIQAPSLYWHFKSKQALFQTLANEVAKEALQSVNLEGEWEEQLYHFVGTFRGVIGKYPCSAQLLMRTVPSELDYLALINSLLQIVDHLPISDSDKFSSVACLLNYVISFELDKYEQRRVNTAMENEGDGGAQGSFLQALENLGGKGPNVVQRMYHDHLFKELGSDTMFRTGLRIIIAGIAQLAHP